MIIQELCKYYDVLSSEKENDIPKLGFCSAKVSYGIGLNQDGSIRSIIDLRESSSSKPRYFTLPEQAPRSSGINPYFWSDKSDYFFGISKKDKKSPVIKTKDYFEASKELHLKILEGSTSPEAQAVISFFKNWNVDNAESVLNEVEGYSDDILFSSNFVFVVNTSEKVKIPEEINQKWLEYYSSSEDEKCLCMISGEEDSIARLHPKIKGVMDTQVAGANIVSFNDNAYESYGKKQGQNAPVGRRAAFKYGTVLNHLLKPGSNQRFILGDSTVVFWSETANKVNESAFGMFFNPPKKTDETNADEEKIRDKETESEIMSVLTNIRNGVRVHDISSELDFDTNFCVLALSPNAARISVRFFYKDTFGNLMKNFALHLSDMELESDSPQFVSLWLILNNTKNQSSKDSKPSPILSAGLLNAVMKGGLYPAAVYSQILQRIRIDGKISYSRVSFIKAYLKRKDRIFGHNKIQEDLTVSLNENSKNKPYLLGRLFAILENVQYKALGKLNSSIKDSFFSSASTSPRSVLPYLIKLSQHHFAKLPSNYLEIEMAKILDNFDQIPSHLNFEEQGMFILGYYQQKQAFFAGKENKTEQNTEIVE